MRESGHLMVVLGGVLLVAWYGVARMNRQGRPAPPLPSFRPDEGEGLSRRAMMAELAEAPSPTGPEVACLCCGTPWPAGTLFCECGGENAEEEDEWIPPAAPADRERLVCVQVVSSSWKASLLKSYLENNEIDCVAQPTVSRLEVTTIPADRFGSIGLFVPASQEVAARELLEQAA